LGASDVEGQGFRKLLTTAPQKLARAGRLLACTFDTLICPETNGLENSVRDIDFQSLRSGLSSNDGSGSNLLPARSDGLDNIDGGPDVRDIAPWAFRSKGWHD
jgi:hypothetical protein